ncbi:MAG: hypothetical protein KDD02_06105, partial [Phaeodactylibacter sp.]|nr:hypothetical protein [Phaeodactylibacter sp.]
MRRWFFLFLLFLVKTLPAQEEMEVIRCSAVDRQSPISNVFVDEDNNKWVGNSKGVFRVYDAGLGAAVETPTGEQALFHFRDGNYDLSWSVEALKAIAGEDVRITTAIYDSRQSELWVGTADAGLYRLKTGPSLQLLEQLATNNSKLKSNHINTLFLDARGRLWVGTEQGVLVGEGGRWKLLEKDFNILGITGKGLEIWLLGDGLVGRVDARDTWLPIEIPSRRTEGPLRDITFDDAGQLWIASEVVTRYNPETEAFTVFGPAQEFTSQFAVCLAADRDGAIWVGTEDKGLYLIQKASAMTVNILIEKEPSCAGSGKNGALKVKVSGGQPPYDFKWDGGLAGENPKGLAPGSFTLTVSDSKGKTKIARMDLPAPNSPQAAAAVIAPASTGQADGQASASATGGTAPYSYAWDNGETTATATKLAPGAHTLTITDAAGCKATASVQLSEDILPLTVSLRQTGEIQCAGGSGGSLEVETRGGKGPYEYKWSDARLNGARASGLKAGEYSLTVVDATGQSQSASLAVVEPLPIEPTANVVASAST